MTFKRLLTSILALAVFALPASASTTIYTDATAFANATASLFFPDPLTSFTASGLMPGNLEYADQNTATDFFGFQSNGTTPDTLSVNGTKLQTVTAVGDVIGIVMPANTYAFAGYISVLTGFGIECIEPTSTFNTSSNCNTTINAFTSPVFIGVFSTTPLTTLWIGPQTGSSTLQIDNFEIGEETPEVATFLMIGSGLIFVRFLRRFRTPQEA
jgi:hypothetical protein